MADYKKEIIGKINKLSGCRSPYEVFYDWIKCSAIAIQNSCRLHDNLWEKREEQFMQTLKPYGESGADFGDMLGILSMALENDIDDVLGKVYMEAELGNKSTGQFFTPFHVSRMCAELALQKEDGNQKITINEPSCGAGGMIIAAAAVLKDRGINYQRCLNVVAQDLDWKAVYMCYVQLSLLGIRAVVVQGDTLSEPYVPGETNQECIFYTPKHMGVLL